MDGYNCSVGTKYTVLRIRDVYPGSRILDPDFYPSRIPDLGSRIPDPKTAMKDSSVADPGCLSKRQRIPDPDPQHWKNAM
jgi:hypothetical protein